MKIAHTIVKVPLHIERVPTYTRRQLAASGPRVAIGCAYQPSVRIAPSVHTPPPQPSNADRYIKGAACVGMIAFIGAAIVGVI